MTSSPAFVRQSERNGCIERFFRTLKPRDQWRAGMTYAQLQAEMDAALQFAGFRITCTQPTRNRLGMLLTGIKTARRYQDCRGGPERDPASRP